VKSGQAPSFSTGYFLSGGLMSFIICFDLALESRSFIFYALEAVLPNEHSDIASFTGLWYLDFLLMFVFFVVQLAVAMIGGGLANRSGLRMVRNVRAKPEIAAMPVTDKV
jgi:hypothetical protein